MEKEDNEQLELRVLPDKKLLSIGGIAVRLDKTLEGAEYISSKDSKNLIELTYKDRISCEEAYSFLEENDADKIYKVVEFLGIDQEVDVCPGVIENEQTGQYTPKIGIMSKFNSYIERK